ncbi:MAG: GGDEF domain-containing protein, partial [Solirubrobacteraceae bacterium]|nr:GGDEF domain-containing protein [Solirubrobacteraceae bacterium]
MKPPFTAFVVGAFVVTCVGAATLGLGVTALVWGSVVVLAHGWFFRHPLFTRAERVGMVLSALCFSLWLASDAVRVLGDPGVVSAAAELLGGAGLVVLVVMIVWVVHRRGEPRIETWLDGLIFIAALTPPLWLAIVEPALETAIFPWVAAWAVLTLAVMYIGGVYVMSGGVWNRTAVLFAVAVIGNTIVGVGLQFADPAQVADVPRFLVGYLAWAAVGIDPQRLKETVQPGGRRTGIPLSVRVWMLVPTVAIPLVTLGWCHVQGLPLPTTVIAGSFAVIAVVVAIRARLLARAGVRDWSVPLTISVTALLVTAVAVSLALLSQSARTAQERADAYARQATAMLNVKVPGVQGAATPRLGAPAPMSAVDARSVSEEITRRQETARARAREVRLFTVGALTLTLFLVAALLLRFNRARRRMELQHQQMHDVLTGLPNRHALDRQLREGAATAASAGGRTLVLLDLDDFKAINDSLGHAAGDDVLHALTKRLEASRMSDQLLVRIDGDAFGILVPAGHDAMAVAHRMLATLAAPFELDDGPHVVHGSVGIA